MTSLRAVSIALNLLGTAAVLVTAAVARPQTAAAAPELPLPRSGWRCEQIAGPPTLRHPAWIETAPDGRVFVSEDPMDIAAEAHETRGRILVFHPDGRTTVFADGLHAPFGMAYLDGRLYVLHNPRIDVYEDAGDVGRNPRTLFAQTHPQPWAGGWNDHIPGNFRLAMDGYFYLAVGDKGLYGMTGPDGRRIDMAGGGIVRFRPDGTGLEIFARGVRNIMDVAVDADDGLFTYDNTDEQQWMSRLTHMVDGGVYGYPYDFIPQQPHTLWMMADYGGGAATGALAYTEDALPAELRGNLFLGDFGKRQIVRVPVARTGSTYIPQFREDLFPSPPHDFRPVGLAVSADGLSFYIADWNHTDSKEKVDVGRLFKLTYTGESHAAPKPGWFVPAAMGKAFAAGTADLLTALRHPARSVRMVAQRRLADRKDSAGLRALLDDSRAPARARVHALWALDAIDGGRAERVSILRAAADGDAAVRRQALRQLGGRAVTAAASLATKALHDSNAGVRFEAAAALGRLASPKTVPALLTATEDTDLFARFAAFTALSRVGARTPAAWPAIAAGLTSPSARVREATGFALRASFDPALVAALAKMAKTVNAARAPQTRRLALEALAPLHRKTPPFVGKYWGTHPAYAAHPKQTQDWEGTAIVTAALERGLSDSDAAVRAAAAEGIGKTGTPPAHTIARLRALLTSERDPGIRARVLTALVTLNDKQSAANAALLLKDTAAGLPVRISALNAVEHLGGFEPTTEAAIVHVLETEPPQSPLHTAAVAAAGRLKLKTALAALAKIIGAPDEATRSRALDAVAAVGGPDAAALLRPLLTDAKPALRASAARALGLLGGEAQVTPLKAAVNDKDPAVADAAVLALASLRDASALQIYLTGLTHRRADVRNACALAIGALGNKVLPTIETAAQANKLPATAIAALQDIFDRNARARRGPLFAISVVRHEANDYAAFALSNPGVPAHGREVFTEAGCVRCHALSGTGGDLGPDLGTIGTQSPRPLLVQSVLEPSRVVREGFEQIGLLLVDGTDVAGILRGETADTVTMRQADGKTRQIPKATIAKRSASTLSLMPEGLQQGMSLQDFADLISFLESLR